MARRKVKEVEEDITNEGDNNSNKKRQKSATVEQRSQRKRKVVENELNDKSKPKKKTPERREPIQISSKKSAIPEKKNNQKGRVIAQNELMNTVSKPKKEPESKKKIGKGKSREHCTKSETEPKLKKARLGLKRVKLSEDCDSENNHTSPSSTDSGILSEPTMKNVNCISSVKYELTNSLENLESSGFEGEASTSESEWEEVEENDEQEIDDYKPDIPKEGVEITIDCPDLNTRRHKKKQFDEMEYIRLYINRERKEHQLNVHKTHLLCLLAHGFYVNNVLNSPILKGIALSLLPADLLKKTSGKKIDTIDSHEIENIVMWFRSSFSFEQEKTSFLNISTSMLSYFENQKSLNGSEYNLMFIVLARTLGFKTRFCISLYALTHKAQNLIKKPNAKKTEKKNELSSDIKIKAATENKVIAGPSKVKSKKKKAYKQVPKENIKVSKKVKEQASDVIKVDKHSRPRRSAEKSYKMSSDEEDNDIGSKDEDFDELQGSEDDFEDTKPLKKLSAKTPKQKTNRKALSTDSEPSSPETSSFKCDKIVCWAEVFSKPDKQWVSVECVKGIVNKPYDIESTIPQPVSYILAYDNDSFVKDVTRRYCSDYLISTIKLRADIEWWEETLLPFLPPNSKLDKEEEKNLETMLINKPLPHTVAGFKNHPLYALKRHLLKFEAIYPPDAAAVGFIRGEPVYARECVCQLHSRETWLKEARVVRIGEEPYKIVKARPKWDRIAGVMRTDLPLEIFGFWQTKPYEPPIAVDGKVPRNEYGNVELFKPCMLPRGTVHLQLSGLNRVAKKLGIDCSAAVVGFDGHKGSVHAVFDGFIVCEEYKDTIIAAWEEEQVNAQKREEEKREKRIYGNWKKLIRGLLIRERIKLKYDVKQ